MENFKTIEGDVPDYNNNKTVEVSKLALSFDYDDIPE